MVKKRQAHFYRDLKGKEPAREWITSLKDSMARAKILTRIARAEGGNFGDHKSVGEGVFELRIDYGPGFRIYYALDGEDIVLILIGGDKSSQDKDIETAKIFWKNHKAEKENG